MARHIRRATLPERFVQALGRLLAQVSIPVAIGCRSVRRAEDALSFITKERNYEKMKVVSGNPFPETLRGRSIGKGVSQYNKSSRRSVFVFSPFRVFVIESGSGLAGWEGFVLTVN